MKFFILDGKSPVEIKSPMKWAQWMDSHREERQVALTQIRDTYVSTIFFGVDASLLDPTLLFETLIIGGDILSDEFRYEIRKYASWQESEYGHLKICEKIRSLYEKD